MKLIPERWYYCNEAKVQREVKFIATETYGAMEGLAYVEFKDEHGAIVGWYVLPESLESLSK